MGVPPRLPQRAVQCGGRPAATQMVIAEVHTRQVLRTASALLVEAHALPFPL